MATEEQSLMLETNNAAIMPLTEQIAEMPPISIEMLKNMQLKRQQRLIHAPNRSKLQLCTGTIYHLCSNCIKYCNPSDYDGYDSCGGGKYCSTCNDREMCFPCERRTHERCYGCGNHYVFAFTPFSKCKFCIAKRESECAKCGKISDGWIICRVCGKFTHDCDTLFDKHDVHPIVCKYCIHAYY